ncbi:hypothetical protein [Aquimarina mytili]|uniref:Uncharacterized protein n=1 Tax=Aquimarina mytili TaxID=874423 RepID=A0A936ZT96_9FLAO|nr:hypothetical protein [Aquimarina mytili]MBL0683887.1 hypothetical protein [Aquimarina mytili]
MDYEVIAVIIFFCCISGSILWLGFRSIKNNNIYYKKIDENLKDEYIIDPETGTRLTLEQLEKGYHEGVENDFGIVPETEIEKLYTEEEKKTERAFNYLKRNCTKLTFDNDQRNILEQTKILNQYNIYRYSNPFKLKNGEGVFLIVYVELGSSSDIPYSVGSYYAERQVMFWLPVNFDLGHYYFREKTSIEKLISKVKNTNDFKLAIYETFIFEKTKNTAQVKRILEKIEQYKNLEIEFINTNIFIKNLRYANIEDIHKIEELAKAISQL